MKAWSSQPADSAWYREFMIDGCRVIAHRGDFVDMAFLGDHHDWQLLATMRGVGRDLSACELRRNVWRVFVLQDGRTIGCDVTGDAELASIGELARKLIAAREIA